MAATGFFQVKAGFDALTADPRRVGDADHLHLNSSAPRQRIQSQIHSFVEAQGSADFESVGFGQFKFAFCRLYGTSPLDESYNREGSAQSDKQSDNEPQ